MGNDEIWADVDQLKEFIESDIDSAEIFEFIKNIDGVTSPRQLLERWVYLAHILVPELYFSHKYDPWIMFNALFAEIVVEMIERIKPSAAYHSIMPKRGRVPDMFVPTEELIEKIEHREIPPIPPGILPWGTRIPEAPLTEEPEEQADPAAVIKHSDLAPFDPNDISEIPWWFAEKCHRDLGITIYVNLEIDNVLVQERIRFPLEKKLSRRVDISGIKDFISWAIDNHEAIEGKSGIFSLFAVAEEKWIDKYIEWSSGGGSTQGIPELDKYRIKFS